MCSGFSGNYVQADRYRRIHSGKIVFYVIRVYKS